MTNGQPLVLHIRSPGLLAAIAAAGSINKLAAALQINQSAVSRWTRVPAHQVIPIEQLLGVPRSALRPELYPEERG